MTDRKMWAEMSFPIAEVIWRGRTGIHLPWGLRSTVGPPSFPSTPMGTGSIVGFGTLSPAPLPGPLSPRCSVDRL